MQRFRPGNLIILAGAALAAVSMLTAPGLAHAQTPEPGSPALRVESWSVSPETLTRGIEFELSVRVTNAGTAEATNINIVIGSGASFVALTPGKFIESLDEGESTRVTLSGAVSNSITTGYYSIPIQISYQQASGVGIPTTDIQTVGVYVEGLTPPGQDTGLPSFSVTSFSIQPEQPKRGEEFDLTLTIQNIGTWDGNDVVVEIGQSQSFVGLAAGETITHMQIGESRTVRLRGAVSNQIVTGHYSIPIAISYHHAALGGQRMTDAQTIGTQVQGIAPNLGPDTGRPQLVIEDSTLQPGPGEGELVMTLTLRNVGDRWATRVVVNLSRSEILSPAEGSTAFPVEGTIRLDETATLTLPLRLIRSPGERAIQDFTIEYASFSGGQYQATQSVPIELGSVAQDTPRLLVEQYSTDPAVVTPGAAFRLTLDVRNVGGGEARQVFVRLGQNAAALGPLAPIGSGNVLYVERIAGSSQVTLAFDLLVSGEAESGLVPLDLTLEYQDAFGVQRTETVTISVQLVATPFLSIDFFDALPDPIYVGDFFDLPIEVINIGQRQVNVSNVEVTSERLRITGGSLYVGPLDGGTSGTLIPEAEALQAGTAEVVVRVNYLDSFQQPQVLTQTLTVEVEAVSLEEGNNNAPGNRRPAGQGEANTGELTFGQRVWRAVLGFLGLGTTPPEETLAGST